MPDATPEVVLAFDFGLRRIGVAIGDDRLVIRSLDNCSVTVMDVEDGRLRLVEGGHEADTLIR